jgi:single-strand DNA-binding protein
MNYSKALFGGHISRDLELKYTQSGIPVLSFAVAVNRKVKDTQEVSFFDCVAWGKTAESINSFFQKGSAIFLECEPYQEKWQDKSTGKNMFKIVFKIDSFLFVGKKEDREDAIEYQPLQKAPIQSHYSSPTYKDIPMPEFQDDDNNDVPF